MAARELKRRGSGYILKVESTRTCFTSNVRGKRKNEVKDLQGFWPKQLEDGWGDSVRGADVRG